MVKESQRQPTKKHGWVWVLVSAVCTATLLAATARSNGDSNNNSSNDKNNGNSNSNDDRGGDDGVARLSARDIADRARQELLTTTSLHVTVVDRSRGAGGTAPSSMDLALDREGNCTATLTFGADGKANVVRRGDRVWMRMDDKLWQAQVPGAEGKAAADLLKGRYVTGSVDKPVLKNLAGVCDWNTLRRQLRGQTASDEVGKKGSPTTLDGTPVIPLSGEERNGTRKTLYVATRGKPYPLKYTEVSAGAPGTRKTDTTTLYADYGQPVLLRTPSASDSVDIAKLDSLDAI
ncbi:hypothetical protein [Streptomyces sp. NPDC016845]|uniref:hypothetical protein n=1 Tax=Streptomyces sp. NPDC016845 TaxID=3364972 RepID=UPI0037947837